MFEKQDKQEFIDIGSAESNQSILERDILVKINGKVYSLSLALPEYEALRDDTSYPVIVMPDISDDNIVSLFGRSKWEDLAPFLTEQVLYENDEIAPHIDFAFDLGY